MGNNASTAASLASANVPDTSHLQHQLLWAERSQLRRPPAQQLLLLRNMSRTECYSHTGVVSLLSNPLFAALISKLRVNHPLLVNLRALSLLSPNTVTDLAQLRSSLADVVPAVAEFRGTTRQQDSHEFVVSLLFALETVLRDVGDPRQIKALSDFLSMEVIKTRHCGQFGALHPRVTTEVEIVLSLPIVHPTTGQPLLTLTDCLQQYLAKEVVNYRWAKFMNIGKLQP